MTKKARKQEIPIKKSQELKDLFASDPGVIAEENDTKEQDDSLNKIIDAKYVWQDGVGLVPKSVFVPKFGFTLREDEDFKTV